MQRFGAYCQSRDSPADHRGKLEDTDGKIDILVSGIGTGGTVTGAGQVLKQIKPEVQVVAVRPSKVPAPGDWRSGPAQIPGIGATTCRKCWTRGSTMRSST